MGVKFSQIEKLSQRTMVIENGKPYWREMELNGEIKFNPINEELANKLQQNVLSKLENNMDEDLLAYMLIPYLTDIEDDIDFERYKNMMNNKNEIILVLKEGILDLFNSMIEYADKSQRLEEKSKEIESKMPQLDIKELKRKELEDLYNRFAIVTDKKERNELLQKVIQLKNELGE